MRILTFEEKLDPQHAAIVVVDVQNDFCHPEGAVAVHCGARVDEAHNRESMRQHLPPLLEAAREAGALLVFVRMINDPVYQSPPNAERLQKLGIYGKGLLEGTWGADYWEGIAPRPDAAREVEVVKHRYSAFIGTNLDQLLRGHGIKTLAFTGVATSGCVESTARDGLFFDYYVMMVGDCCSDGKQDRHDASLRKFEGSFGEVVGSDEIMRVWAARTAPVAST